MRLVLLVGVATMFWGIVSVAGPTAADLEAWARQHWDDLGHGRREAVVAAFDPAGALAFMGGPFSGFFYEDAVAQAWEAFFATIPVRGYAVVDGPQVLVEARIVYARLRLELEEGQVVLSSFLLFSDEGQLRGADYVVEQGLAPVGPSVDGNLDTDEYRNHVMDPRSGVSLSWQNGVVVFIAALRSPGTGWVAAGFDPVYRMEGANYVIAAVTPTGLVIEDHVGTGPTAHRRDRRQDILMASGTVAGGQTTVEFVIPLDSRDPEDKPLRPGQTYTVLLAYHRSSSSFTAAHTQRGVVRIILER